MSIGILPNTIIVGAQKAGTTSVYNWLSQHPDIYAPFHLKDLPFFTNDELYHKGLDFYKHLFDNWQHEKIITTCETNCIFFEYSHQRVYHLNPNIKIILLLRNPINRAFSAYRYAVERGLEERNFKQAIEEELNEQRNYSSYFVKAQKHYVQHGLYYQQLTHFLRYFSLDQIYIELLEKLSNNKEQLIKDIFKFLGVNTDVKIKFTKENPTLGGYKFKFLNYILHKEQGRSNSIVSFILEQMPTAFRYKLQRKIYTILSEFNKKKVPVPPIDTETKNKLIEIYKEDTDNLSKLINKDLVTLWFKK